MICKIASGCCVIVSVDFQCFAIMSDCKDTKVATNTLWYTLFFCCVPTDGFIYIMNAVTWMTVNTLWLLVYTCISSWMPSSVKSYLWISYLKKCVLDPINLYYCTTLAVNSQPRGTCFTRWLHDMKHYGTCVIVNEATKGKRQLWLSLV